METGYQRSKIQEESLYYEHKKYDGSYPIISVNTFRNPHGDFVPQEIALIRSTEEEKQSQLKGLAEFHKRNAKESPAMLKRLQQAVIENQNVFAVLMDAVRVCSLSRSPMRSSRSGGSTGGRCERYAEGRCRSPMPIAPAPAGHALSLAGWGKDLKQSSNAGIVGASHDGCHLIGSRNLRRSLE